MDMRKIINLCEGKSSVKKRKLKEDVDMHGYDDSSKDLTSYAIDKAKKGENSENCRNRINIFGMTVKWKDMDALQKIKDKLIKLSETGIDDNKISNGFLYSLIKFSEDAAFFDSDTNKSLQDKKLSEWIEASKWKARLSYSIFRNYGKKESLKEELVKLIDKHKDKMKIPISITLYSIRRIHG